MAKQVHGEPADAIRMIGEHVVPGITTGELDRMLLRVAEAYEVSVDRRIDAMFKIVEPLLLILMAIVVGFIVVALFMPLMSIMGQLGAA